MRIFSDPLHIDTPCTVCPKTIFGPKTKFFAKLAKWSILIFVPKIAEKLNSIAEKLHNIAEKVHNIAEKMKKKLRNIAEIMKIIARN